MKNMNSFSKSMGIFFALAIFFASQALAGSMGGSGHGGHGGAGEGYGDHADHSGGKSSQMRHEGHRTKNSEMEHMNHGKIIHSSRVDGFNLSYELIDMRERMKNMPNMPEMTATHHLMVYVEEPDGQTSGKAKAGYLIVGPDGEKQTVMGVGMAGGYGADVNLTEKGVYTIKTKIVTENEKVMDSFTHRID